MTDYVITFARSARKELENLNTHIVNRIFPKIEALASGTLACGLVQLGLMRRHRLPLFQLSPFPPHQPLIRWAHIKLRKQC
jgi:hypothetical protein